MKRLLILMSCVVLVASPLALAQQENPTPQDRDRFADIPPTHWAFSTANVLARVGVIQGDLQGRFNGNAPLKRADFAIVLHRLSLSPWASPGSSAPVIPNWAQEQKSYFTRYEFAVVLSRLSPFLNPGFGPFTNSEAPDGANQFRDIPRTHWARLAVNQEAGLGILQGDYQGRFNGDAILTRYEFAVALLNHSIFRDQNFSMMESSDRQPEFKVQGP